MNDIKHDLGAPRGRPVGPKCLHLGWIGSWFIIKNSIEMIWTQSNTNLNPGFDVFITPWSLGDHSLTTLVAFAITEKITLFVVRSLQ